MSDFSDRTDTLDVDTDETNALIASNKVEGTEVYNRQGEHLGEVYNFMVNKRPCRCRRALRIATWPERLLTMKL